MTDTVRKTFSRTARAKGVEVAWADVEKQVADAETRLKELEAEDDCEPCKLNNEYTAEVLKELKDNLAKHKDAVESLSRDVIQLSAKNGAMFGVVELAQAWQAACRAMEEEMERHPGMRQDADVSVVSKEYEAQQALFTALTKYKEIQDGQKSQEVTPQDQGGSGT